jgi:tetratricopeptide (TPR) repeat protein
LGRRAKSVAGIRGFKQLEAGDIFLEEVALDDEDLTEEKELERLRKLEEERHEGQRTVLRKFSNEIKSIQRKLVRRQVSETPALMHLGSLYMDSQRFLDSLSRADRARLFKKDSELIPGGAELAIVAYKMALERRPSDGRLSMILGEIYEGMSDFENAEIYGRKAFSMFSRSRQTQLAKETQEFLISIEKQKTQTLTSADNASSFNLLPASLSESDLP